MRKFLLTLTALVPLCFAMPTEADAKVRVNLFFGIPYYSHSLGSDYRFFPGRGWYRDHRPYARQKISCQRARQIIRNHGYRNVTRRECNGATYTFRATRNGRSVLVYVNARSGAIWRR